MVLRFLIFLFWQLLGGAIGWWQGSAWGAALGAAVAAWVWFVLDMWRGGRMLRWLRQGDVQRGLELYGLWGEAVERVRRLVRQQQDLVRESDKRLQDILGALQASPNGVVLLDEEGRIEWCNDTAAEHFGFDPQRDALQSIRNLVRDPEFNAYLAEHDYARDVVLEGRGSTPSRPVRVSVHVHTYGEGRALLLSRDVTALEQAEAMRRDFVANVSHEIRTPLTVLAGFVETLQNLPLEEDERRRYLELMAQQAERMQHLVQDLLTLSRLEGSPAPSLDEWTPVQQLLQRCEREAQVLSGLVLPAGAAPHALHFPDEAAQRAAGQIAGRAAELHSALSNLVSNAVRYTPAGGVITVQWTPLPDGSARFSVRDNGPGIAPEHLPRLTERFYRVDRSRSRDTGGTGLGLAIVKHVLLRHGAKLEIESVPGRGSVFSALFPASRLRPAEPTR